VFVNFSKTRLKEWLVALPYPRFEASFARIFGHEIGMNDRADAFFEAFYERFTKAPAINVMFASTDMVRQAQMLKKSLFHLVSYYAIGRPTPELDRLAELHAQLRLPPELFDAWMRALIDTAGQFDEEFDEATELAWCWALAPALAYMQLQLHKPQKHQIK